MAIRLKGWRFTAFMGIFVGSVLTFQYFTALRPMMNPEPYKKIRESNLEKFNKPKWQ